MKAEAEALAVQRESELRRADHDLDRARPLLDRGHLTPADFEVRQTARDVAAAALRAAEAGVATAARRIAAQEAEVRRIAAQIADGVLRAPAEARVLYRLTEPGEVAPAGRTLLTLLSLENVYMEAFLPAAEAARTPIGGEARIVLDALPDYAIPAVVSFVSPEAQFTPRQVETLAEREKLMFRVRVRIPPELVRKRSAHVKTGVRGVAHIRLDPSAPWPERLERRIPPGFFE
jgi:HlyD family secretion protein